MGTPGEFSLPPTGSIGLDQGLPEAVSIVSAQEPVQQRFLRTHPRKAFDVRSVASKNKTASVI